jgi:hypothetical protein
MRKRFIIALIAIVIVVLAVLCLIPSPLNEAKAADGGTKVYSPVLPVYTVVDWNHIEIAPHNPEGPEANMSNGKTTKGIQVFVFGVSVYDGRYTVDGIHTR